MQQKRKNACNIRSTYSIKENKSHVYDNFDQDFLIKTLIGALNIHVFLFGFDYNTGSQHRDLLVSCTYSPLLSPAAW